MKTVVIIQARMGSSRLPGKVMLDLCGKTVLNHVIDRVRVACENIVIATSNKAQDDAIEAEAKKCGAKVFRGSETDVLSRYYGAAVENKADLVVRVTSDCPLYDGSLLADMLKYREDEDYLTNTIERRFPRGLDTETFTFAALEKCYNEAKLEPQREHVTPYIYQNPDKFKIRHYKQQPNLSDMRWTLDTEEDWQMISEVYKALYKGKIFSTVDVVYFLEENPQIAALNAHIEQKKVTG
jgi:spore coat polysaccharide biosynthesis protein SpsF